MSKGPQSRSNRGCGSAAHTGHDAHYRADPLRSRTSRATNGGVMRPITATAAAVALGIGCGLGRGTRII